jgi:hypothetical protein
MRTARDGGKALLGALQAHGGTVGRLVDEAALSELEFRPGPAQVAASGPRASDHPDHYELLLEIIAEGSHLHYGPQRIVRTDDQDLALLLGDQLYALGLARLAAIGDREAVTELADAISLVAQAQAASDPDLAEAAWQAGAVAVGWGSSDRHTAAKRLARSGDGAARGALRSAALVPSS